MEGTHIRKIILTLGILVFLSGCTENGVRIHNSSEVDVSKAEELLADDDRLKVAVALFHDKELLTGVRVDTFSRFRKAKIEKELKKKLEQYYPELKVTVSADSKILMEANKLLDEHDEKALAKHIKKLKSLSKEET